MPNVMGRSIFWTSKEFIEDYDRRYKFNKQNEANVNNEMAKIFNFTEEEEEKKEEAPPIELHKVAAFIGEPAQRVVLVKDLLSMEWNTQLESKLEEILMSNFFDFE